ncbi:MAG: PH domain-containing protein [Oscillospiraceae bacterium]|nr:PH domain-containing protein [Oscillospiraceae bacterium]
MIDFQNTTFLKLKSVSNDTFSSVIVPILVSGEEILGSYQTVRDGVVFTTKRIIAVNIQGITGKKKDITSLPYSKIQAFSVETAGTLDLDSELDLWFSGLGNIKFEFTSNCNVTQICRTIGEYVL